LLGRAIERLWNIAEVIELQPCLALS